MSAMPDALTPTPPFRRSRGNGSSEDGNTLITESNGGRVLEVTPDHRIVWEFVNPNRVGENNELTAVVNFMKRIRRPPPAP